MPADTDSYSSKSKSTFSVFAGFALRYVSIFVLPIFAAS